MNQKIIISPSIMCSTPSNMEGYIREFEKVGIDTIHFDIMDGHYVPNVMLGVRDYQAIKRMTDIPVDIHMMCTAPDAFIDIFKPQPGDWVSIHPETCYHPYRTLQHIRELGCKAAISLKPKTPAEAAIPYLEKCDMILVMTVEPGFGGQSFMEDMMPKLKKLRKMLDKVNPQCVLQVDGGVDEKTCAVCKENGAEVLVAGSAYFKAKDRGAFVKQIQA